MRYPNLRYGNPEGIKFYAQGMTVKELAKRLRRSERSVKDWLSGAKKVPWWVPEILRLQHQAHCEMMRQMGMAPVMKQLGLVTADVLVFPALKTSLEESPAYSRPEGADLSIYSVARSPQ